MLRRPASLPVARPLSFSIKTTDDTSRTLAALQRRQFHRLLYTTGGLETTPIVEDGVIYTTGSWNVVYALDAKAGKMLWQYDPAVDRSRA